MDIRVFYICYTYKKVTVWYEKNYTKSIVCVWKVLFSLMYLLNTSVSIVILWLYKNVLVWKEPNSKKGKVCSI